MIQAIQVSVSRLVHGLNAIGETLKSTALASLLSFLITILPLAAQVNTSTLAGLVKDETGSAVPNANEAGEFVVPQLPPGSYRLNVTSAGFQTAVVDNIPLNIAGREIININLKLGQVNDQVTVEATSAPLLE
jgi:hypothetical protein